MYWFWLVLPLIISCSNDKDSITDPVQPDREVRLILPSNGLGDMSFSDDIMRGVLKAQRELGFSFQYHVPTDADDAWEKIQEWSGNEKIVNSLTILGSNEYEDIAAQLNNDDTNHSYLLIEASSSGYDIPAFRFSGYGVSFLTGIAAYSYTNADTAAYIGGQRNHSYIEECHIGFRDGYLYAGGKGVVSAYLSDEPDGFSMADNAFLLADSLYRKYSFIYPVAGGSNTGIYSWLRNNPDGGKYTSGVDVDQSALSNQIIGSMIKEIGRSLYDYILLWNEGEELTRWSLFDLQSDYTYYLVSEPYKDKLEDLITSHKNIAIERESEYNHGRYE